MAKLSQKYSIERKYVTNPKARPRLLIAKVRFLVAHETANNSADADAHYRYFNNINFSASAHAFIDDTKILEIIPINEKAWHVNYNKPTDNEMYGDDANDAAIGTELCRTGNFARAYDKYVWYHAYLCHKFGLDPVRHIVSHKVLDPQRRSDPQSWLNPNGVTWIQFVADVKRYYDEWDNEGTNGGTVTVKPPKPQTKPAQVSGLIRMGDKGSAVKKIQRELIDAGFDLSKYGADGHFGAETLKAVTALQEVTGLNVDGIVGPKTRKKLATYKNPDTKASLSVDGYLGPKTIRAMQRYFNTPVDGKLSRPSLVIKSLQKLVGTKQDGYLGPNTIRAMQRRFGTPVDGKISKPSLVIKELQRRLNRGKL